MTMRVKPPKCARCGKQVDSFDAVRSNQARTYEFEARCHGSTQKVVITQKQLVNAGRHGIKMCDAFADEAQPLLTGGAA